VEVVPGGDDKWADPPMPRDYQMLQPWTQHLLRLARSGKVGTKRKQDPDSLDDDKPEDEITEEANKNINIEDRGYIAKKWKPVPEHLLEPEHKHFEFLAKRRKGLPSLYGPEQLTGIDVPMRKTKVQKAGANGEIAVYDVLVPEGQTVEGEVTETTELADVTPVVAAPGTVIEGVGIANEEGVVVAEHLKPAVASRRNRPPPKKKGGPGRGKKRVTFTNPDGSTYTTVVPNATKIIPQPGQTVKHVAKGEEAGADVTAEQAAAAAPGDGGAEAGEEGDGGEEGSGSDEEDDGSDDDREDGELSDDERPANGDESAVAPPEDAAPEPMEDVQPTHDKPEAEKIEDEAEPLPTQAVEAEAAVPETAASEPAAHEPVDQVSHDPPSSPDLPLAASHSRSESMPDAPEISLDAEAPAAEQKSPPGQPPVSTEDPAPTEEPPAAVDVKEPSPVVEEPATSAAVDDVPAVPVAEELAAAEPTKSPEAAVDESSAITADPPEVAESHIVEAETIPQEAEEGEDAEKQPEGGNDDLLGNLEKHLGAE
jgi:hypothetical protein